MPRASGNSDTTPTEFIECSASLVPTVLTYELAKDELTLRSGADEVVLTRYDGLATTLFGFWDAGTEDIGGPFDLRVSGTFEIIANRVSIRAHCSSNIGDTFVEATSRAKIDDTTIEIIEADSHTKRVVRQE